MPRRIVIHAGFHKTGTSSIQATLRENREALKKHVALRLRWYMKDLLSAARGYSTWRDPLSLIKVQDRFTTLFDDLPPMPRRTLVLSAEELAGHMPGRGDLDDYSAAPVLLSTYCDIAQAQFPRAEIMVYLSTRAPGAWLASAYWEHVKASNMTLGFDEFAARYRGASDLDAVVCEIGNRVSVPVHHRRLEDCADLPLGPADPLLDLCELPLALRRDFIAPPPANTRLDGDVLYAMLEANRTHAETAARNAAKAFILKQAQHP